MSTMIAINFLLNLSFVFALLAAPCLLVLAFWYRRNLGRPSFVWQKSELVLATIVYIVLSLILLVVGITSFCLHVGYIDSANFPISSEQFLFLGLACMVTFAGLSMLYLALRLTLVQMVMEEGVVLTRGLLPTQTSCDLLKWGEIVDYYVTPDYPNATFTFIVGQADLTFERRSIKVPIYLREDFQQYLDKKIYTAQNIRSSSEISSHNFLEN